MTKSRGFLLMILILALGENTLQGQDTPFMEGRELFESYCADCHRANGEGLPPTFPALNHNQVVTSDSGTELLTVILNGRKTRGATMPAWKDRLNDHQISAIVNYIRQAWNNKAAPLAPETIEALRKR